MRKSTLAALDHAAQKKLVETARRLARVVGVQVPDNLAVSQGPPEVQMMKQRVAMGDLLEVILKKVKLLQRKIRTLQKGIKTLQEQNEGEGEESSKEE